MSTENKTCEQWNWIFSWSYFFFFFFNTYIFIWERGGGGTEREGERESQMGTVLSAQSPTPVYLTNCVIMTWADIKIDDQADIKISSWMLNQPSHPGAPEAMSKESVKDTSWVLLTIYTTLWEDRNGLKMELLIKMETGLKGIEYSQPFHIVKEEKALLGKEHKWCGQEISWWEN